jgi:chorismate mutase
VKPVSERLQSLRQRVDETDEKIVELLRTRLELVLQMADCKNAEKLPLRDTQREQEVLRRVELLNQRHQPTLPSDRLAEIFKTVMGLSLRAQEERSQSSERNQ